MRKTLFALTALVGLIGAGAATTAPAHAETIVTTVQYYGGGYDPRAAEWREREWRQREWERHRRWEEERRWHEWHRGW